MSKVLEYHVIESHWFIDVFVEDYDLAGDVWWRKDFSATKCQVTLNTKDISVLRQYVA